MNLKKVLTPDSVLPQLRPGSKEEVIEQMIDFMAATGKLSDRDTALKAVLEREAKMSTGMQNGIAIPHGKTDSVNQLIITVAVSKEDIDFDALDGLPCRIFILTLSPISRTGPHIQFLAEISKLLGSEPLRQKLCEANGPDEIAALLTA